MFGRYSDKETSKRRPFPKDPFLKCFQTTLKRKAGVFENLRCRDDKCVGSLTSPANHTTLKMQEFTVLIREDLNV